MYSFMKSFEKSKSNQRKLFNRFHQDQMKILLSGPYLTAYEELFQTMMRCTSREYQENGLIPDRSLDAGRCFERSLSEDARRPFWKSGVHIKLMENEPLKNNALLDIFLRSLIFYFSINGQFAISVIYYLKIWNCTHFFSVMICISQDFKTKNRTAQQWELIFWNWNFSSRLVIDMLAANLKWTKLCIFYPILFFECWFTLLDVFFKFILLVMWYGRNPM